MQRSRFLRQGALCVALLLTPMVARAADLVVGANVGNVPWEFQDEAGKFVGFEVELVQKAAEGMGMTARFENIPFNGLFPAVQSQRVAAAISSITITPARLQSLSFTQPYYDSDQSLTVTKASGIKGLGGLAGKTVAVDTGSTGDMWATQNQATAKIKEIRRYEGLNPAMLDLVAAGRLRPDLLVTREVSLDEAGAALAEVGQVPGITVVTSFSATDGSA